MRSVLPLFALISILLFTCKVDGRKELGEYWKGIMRDEPMPEVIQTLVEEETNSGTRKENEEEPSSNKVVLNSKEVSQPKPNVLLLFKGQPQEGKIDEFEPRPNIFFYKGSKDENSRDAFEPKPNWFPYKGHPDEGKNCSKKENSRDAFEPKPNWFPYKGHPDEGKNGEFEPRPNIFFIKTQKRRILSMLSNRSLIGFPTRATLTSDKVKVTL
ncbi:hypothetical protein Tsubulata_041723 [Turnera subulata]|uniref:Organ-specific protein S2 n=1 Tax=Turnera subulata TaxID=218843 RepID=A0A9Q0JM82_9ROSI|nr:hypothetical protein Tsubulata_041723 [Turnera subulata]